MATTTSSTSPVQLQVQTIFGVRSKLESGLFFVDEHTVIYPAGNQFILADVETKSQRIFRCNELERIDWMIVHHGTALIAIVATGMNPEKVTTTISFYDLHTQLGKRKRMFELRDSSMTITSMAFSHDAKHLAILECGNREYTLLLWLWQKSRLVASLKLGAAEGVTVLSQILFHPTDDNLLSIIGRRCCRSIRHLDGNLRLQPSFAKLDQYDFISHAWCDSTRFIAGTSNGHICVLFNGDIQTEMDVIEGRERTVTGVPRSLSTTSSIPKSVIKSILHQHQQEHLDTSRPTGEEVTCICIVNKGFFCLIGGKRLCLYSKIGDSWDFAKTREYIVPNSGLVTTRSSITTHLAPSQVSTDQTPLNADQVMWKVAVSPKEEHVLILSSKQQLYSVSDMTKDHTVESRDPFQLEFVFHSFHQSSIRGLDIAIQKPLFISSGGDHSLRLWNYETNTIEQMKFYHESVYAISIHPNGHQIAVAFASKVCLMNVLIDGFFTVKEFPIHASHGIRFSHGGHLFAAIDSNIIQIISPIHIKVIHRLNHGQSVKQIAWNRNDLTLYSQSNNSFIVWNLINQTKIYEFKPSYRLEGGFTVDREDKVIYLASDDGIIHALYNGQVINEVKLPQDDRVSCLQIFPSNGALLCGTQRGSIYVIKTPLTNSPTGIFHYLAHSAKIQHIIVAFHEALIVTCCADGVLMLWETQIKFAGKSEDWTPVVLHSKTRFLSLSESIGRLRVEEKELELSHEYRLQQMETTYLGDLQRRMDVAEEERHHHENQIERQTIEKEKQHQEFEMKFADLREKFQSEKQRIEEEDRDRMGRELRKEEELIRLSQKMMEDNEFRLKATIEASENEIRDIEEFFTGKIRETENELIAIRAKTRQAVEINEIEKKNIELDIDDEQLKLKLEFENDKKRLLEHNLQLQKQFKETLEHQVHVLNNKLSEQDTVAQVHKKRIHDNHLRVQGMTQEIQALNTEIAERNQTIHEKFDRINDLELKNQELEKFQYVLEYKIDELTRLINPRKMEIERMKNQLIEMASEREKKETEVSRNHFHNMEQQQRLNAIENQIERERSERKQYEYAIQRLKMDMIAHFHNVDDVKNLQKSVIHVYNKHVRDENTKSIYADAENNSTVSEETLAQTRQRLFLERTTADLKTKLNSDLHITRTNRMRIMKENSLLLKELNDLREELKIVRGRLQDYEIAKKTSDECDVHSIDALIQTLNAGAGNYAVRHRENELIKEVQKNQQEILRLRQRLTRAQMDRSTPDTLTIEADDTADEITNISILKLA